MTTIVRIWGWLVLVTLAGCGPPAHTESAPRSVTGASLESVSFEAPDARHAVAELPAALRQERLAPRALAATGSDDVIECSGTDLGKNPDNVIYVTTSGTDSASCGIGYDGACKTIALGIERCGGPGCRVLVGFGRYAPTASIALREGVNVLGGCTLGRSDHANYSLIDAPNGGLPAVTATNISKLATVFQGFKLMGSQAAPTGRASVALLVSGSTLLTFRNVSIYAGQGSDGADAPASPDGADGQHCAACPGGDGAKPSKGSFQGPYFGGRCREEPSSGAGWGACRGGSAGRNGDPACTDCRVFWLKGGRGVDGGAGAHASTCGSAGVQGGNAGTFAGITWTAGYGGAGGPGTPGTGGGGGGAGGWRAGDCFGWTWFDHGNAGGNGASGGCGGLGGQAGQQGGAAFAVVLHASKVTFEQASFIGGKGGRGGRGGAGGKGGRANPQGQPAGSGEGAGEGAIGGGGGAGSAAGGGAGGSGGPAVNVALVAGSSISGTVSHYPGGAGARGEGGPGGVSNGMSPCSGQPGEQGAVGLVADVQTY